MSMSHTTSVQFQYGDHHAPSFGTLLQITYSPLGGHKQEVHFAMKTATGLQHSTNVNINHSLKCLGFVSVKVQLQ